MPIERQTLGTDIIHTVLTGELTDEELLHYYGVLLVPYRTGRWRELVDGTGVSNLAVTPAGMRRLRERMEADVERLREGCVAMVAEADAVYGLFRMWEMKREGLGYDLRVFRRRAEAEAWLAECGREEK